MCCACTGNESICFFVLADNLVSAFEFFLLGIFFLPFPFDFFSGMILNAQKAIYQVGLEKAAQKAVEELKAAQKAVEELNSRGLLKSEQMV